MYNLFVANTDNEWEGDPYTHTIDRCIRTSEYTDEEIVKRYGALSEAQIQEVMQFPCIFAYEWQCHKDPKFGYIRKIERKTEKREAKVKIEYKIIHLDKFLTQAEFQAMGRELDMHGYEYNRTHWAIKDVDLPKVLLAKGIKVSPPQRLRVFLCHSSGDKSHVRDLYHRLIAKSIDAWLDEESLLPGQDWELEVRKALRETDVVIVCLSQDSTNKGGYIQDEITFALDEADKQPKGDIYIIPVKLESCDLPERLQRYQAVNLFEERGFEKLLNALRYREEQLDLPLPIYHVPPHIRNDIKRLTMPASTPPKTPELTEEQLQSIIKAIDVDGRNFENTPATYTQLTEPDLRNIIVGHLNHHFPDDVTGETFVRLGKADIRLKVSEGEILIAECKYWGGEKEFQDAIDQLFGYLTWRYTVGLIIIFSRNFGFTDVLSRIKAATQSHTSYQGGFTEISTTHFRSIHTFPDDPQKKIEMHILAYNLYYKKTS